MRHMTSEILGGGKKVYFEKVYVFILSQNLLVNSPALILPENSGISLARIGSKNCLKSARNQQRLAKIG